MDGIQSPIPVANQNLALGDVPHDVKAEAALGLLHRLGFVECAVLLRNDHLGKFDYRVNVLAGSGFFDFESFHLFGWFRFALLNVNTATLPPI
jgi:hypothetical protein